MIRFLTAGESHGKALNVILEGFPSNFEIDIDKINLELARRQSGYGRGGRMKIEADKSQILSGVRFGKSLGTPISIIVENKDWNNWQEKMSATPTETKIEKISIPRPGHADFTGITKYNYDDIRNSIERSSARETTVRVAAGSIAKQFLSNFGIEIGSFVESIGGIFSETDYYSVIMKNVHELEKKYLEIRRKTENSKVRVLSKTHEKMIIEKIDLAKKTGDTLGGTCVIFAINLPVGLGSFVHYDRRLDTIISKNIMSINAVKAIEFGKGFSIANEFGSNVHDELILKNGKISRKTNFSGGMEGGISNGLPVIVRIAMKPIATLMKPLKTVDLVSRKVVDARKERSDTVAVPACSVIAESMLAWSVAELFVEKFGGDSIEEMKRNYENYTSNLSDRVWERFSK